MSLKNRLNIALYLAGMAALGLCYSDTARAQGNTLVVAPASGGSTLTLSGTSGTLGSAQAFFTVASSGGNIPYTITTSSTGVNWVLIPSGFLSGTATASPMSIPVQVNVSSYGLGTGTYPATITVTPQPPSTAPAVSLSAQLVVNGGGNVSGLSAVPGAVVFNLPAGTTTGSQAVTLSTTNAAAATVTISPDTASSSWLSVSPSSASLSNTTPVNLTVQVNAASLTTGAGGFVNVFLPGAASPSLQIPVTVNLASSNNTELIATLSPSPLTFNVPLGSTVPVNATIAVTSTAGAVTFTAAASSSSGGAWLSVNPATVQQATGSAPATPQLTVTINPSSLGVGSYSGTVTLTPQSGPNLTPLPIPVNVTVSSLPSLSISPVSLSFAYQAGSAVTPAAQTLTLSSNGAALPFSATALTTSGGNWLVVSPTSSSTPASGGTPTSLIVQVSPGGLTAGSYQGQIQIIAPGSANASQSCSASGTTSQPNCIPVTLLVTNSPILQVSNSVAFNYQFNSDAAVTPQQVMVSSSGNPLNFTVSTTAGSGGNWLLASPVSGTTPQAVSFSVDPTVLAGLPPGPYTATATITSPSAGNSPVTIVATLNVTNNTLLTVSQSSVNFNYESSQAAPAPQTITIGSSGAPLAFSVAASTTQCGGNWLSVSNPSSSLTPATISVSAAPPAIAPTSCTGIITITSGGAGNSGLQIPVTLQISSTPLLNVSPPVVNTSATVGTSPANQSFSLTSTDPTVSIPYTVTFSTANGGNWLSINQSSGATPSNLVASFNTSGLPAAHYNGSITITPTVAGSQATVIPVSINVTSANTVSITPKTTLTFNQALGGPAPASQTVQVTSVTPGLPYSATVTTYSGGNWLSVQSGANGTTPGQIVLAVNGANLSQNTYTGVLTILVPSAGNSVINLPVQLVVGAAQSIGVGTPQLTLNYQIGAASAPAAQTVQITGTGGALPFTAAVSSSGTNPAPTGLFTLNPTSGTTPASISVGVSQSVLSSITAAGTYTATLTIASPGLTSQTVALSLVVAAEGPPSGIVVYNAATIQAGPVAPNEIIAIKGVNLGPLTPVNFQVPTGGATVATTLAGVSVTFDGIGAPLIYVSATQINAIVPAEIFGRTTTQMIVSYNGAASSAVQLNVASTVPGVFTSNATGSGQGAILNPDITLNGANNPAPKGSIIAFYATGEGELVGQPPTGTYTALTPPFPAPQAPVSVTIGGLPVSNVFVGEAPGEVQGLLQINVRLPQNIGSGPQPIQLTIGSNSNAAQQVTVYVQ